MNSEKKTPSEATPPTRAFVIAQAAKHKIGKVRGTLPKFSNDALKHSA